MLIPSYRLHFNIEEGPLLIFFLFRMLSPLPRSKCKTEGVSPLSAQSLPHSNCKQRGFPPINHLHPLPCLKHETEGVFPLSAHHDYPSLTQNVRWRGCSLC